MTSSSLSFNFSFIRSYAFSYPEFIRHSIALILTWGESSLSAFLNAEITLSVFVKLIFPRASITLSFKKVNLSRKFFFASSMVRNGSIALISPIMPSATAADSLTYTDFSFSSDTTFIKDSTAFLSPILPRASAA